MSNGKKTPGALSDWDDDDHTVFDDSSTRHNVQLNAMTSLERPAFSPNARANEDEATLRRANPPKQTPGAHPSALPDVGSLTTKWREQQPDSQDQALTSAEQPGVFLMEHKAPEHTIPIVTSIPEEDARDYIRLKPKTPIQHNDFSESTQRHTMPFGEDAVTGFLTPDDILQEEDDSVIELSTQHHLIQQHTDEHPTSPGERLVVSQDIHRLTDEYVVEEALPATPIKGPQNPSFHPKQTSSYSSSQMSFPGEADDEPPRYKLQGPLAKGGMSLISRALDRYFLRDNAMKILDGKLAQDRTHVRRFLEEAQITGQLGHPNIVPVHDIGVGNAGQHYFTMKLIRGETLSEHLKSQHFTPDDEAALYKALQIFLKVCDAVSYAHSRGVIHRDLKPANIMVGSHGQVYVMDWGIALIQPQQTPASSESDEGPIKLQRDPGLTPVELEGDIVGTWNYMAPEQAHGQHDDVGPHTDVFALGAILYEILTDAAPYDHESIYAVLQMAQQGNYVPPQERAPHILLPTGLCDIINKAMQFEPQHRYPSVEELKADIERFLRGGDTLPQRHYQAGTVIIQEGQSGHEAYVISRGRCLVYKTIEGRKVPLREMGPGEVFGETAIFLDQQRTASVEAIDDVTLVIVARDTLEQKLQHDTWLGRFVHTLANRFVDVDQKATHLQHQLQRERLLNHLLTHMQRFGIPTSQGPTATWDSLAQQLCQTLQFQYDELLHIVQQLEQFQLDLTNNQIILSL